MRLLAIDPGNIQSAYCIVDTEDRQPLDFGKVDNQQLVNMLSTMYASHVAIEWISSYGMAVGREVFDTCRWVGRFQEALVVYDGTEAELIERRVVKLHHCNSSRAKDANITQALVDRFAPGQPNHGKGTKAAPGWFYGFKADIWAAYALAVYVADQRAEVS